MSDERPSERARELAETTMRVLSTSVMTRGITDAGVAIGAAAALALGVWRVAGGLMTIEALLIVLMAGTEVFRPLRDLRAADELEKARPEIVDLLIEEAGSTFGKAQFEVSFTVNMLRAVSGEARRIQGDVIPADIPLIQGWELEEILNVAPREGSVLVPAGDGRGTNAAFRRPADLFPLRFGNDSFKPHHAAAQATGKRCVVLNLPGIAVDVDNPEDLHRLASLPGETRAQRMARNLLLQTRTA